MYSNLAWTYPFLNLPDDYADDVEFFHALIQEYSGSRGTHVLDLGCGGGNIDYILKKHFEVTGIDMSKEMLILARQLNPENTYYPGDMRTIRLEKTFDAVLSMYSIEYMLTTEDLRAAFETAFIHLNPGGVFVVGPIETPESYVKERNYCSLHSHAEIEITLLEHVYDPDPIDTTYEATFVYLIRRGGHLEIEVDSHLWGIFTIETWIDLLREAGFDVHQRSMSVSEAKGAMYPVFVGVKPLREAS